MLKYSVMLTLMKSALKMSSIDANASNTSIHLGLD